MAQQELQSAQAVIQDKADRHIKELEERKSGPQKEREWLLKQLEADKVSRKDRYYSSMILVCVAENVQCSDLACKVQRSHALPVFKLCQPSYFHGTHVVHDVSVTGCA